MTTLDRIREKQIGWATSHDKAIDKAGYAFSLNDNLFCPLTRESESQFRSGRGGDLGGGGEAGQDAGSTLIGDLIVNTFEEGVRKT